MCAYIDYSYVCDTYHYLEANSILIVVGKPRSKFTILVKTQQEKEISQKNSKNQKKLKKSKISKILSTIVTFKNFIKNQHIDVDLCVEYVSQK